MEIQHESNQRGASVMTDEDKAKVILEELDKVIQIDWNFEDTYLKAIKRGLKQTEGNDNDEKVQAGSSIDNNWYRLDHHS